MYVIGSLNLNQVCFSVSSCLLCRLLCFPSRPAQNIALCITTFRGQGASMAQQDPCWIDLQSLLESSVLYFLLRASSADAISVSAAEFQMCSCC